MNKILITNSAGFISTHNCVALLDASYQAVGYDNFSNNYPEARARVEKMTNKKIQWVKSDIRY